MNKLSCNFNDKKEEVVVVIRENLDTRCVYVEEGGVYHVTKVGKEKLVLIKTLVSMGTSDYVKA